MVTTQANRMPVVTFQRTAETRRAAPTPMIAPVMVCVVETGIPSQVAANSVIAPPVSAQKPCTGVSRVIRIPMVRTMGSRITRLTPVQGFCAETGGAITLFLATWLGVPVSTTHTITGAIVGVGAARRVSAVRWNVTTGILFAWVVTMPAAAIVGALFYWSVGLFG